MCYRLGQEEIFLAPVEVKRRPIENVLILQGGDSLGAFGCGVHNALVKKKRSLKVLLQKITTLPVSHPLLFYENVKCI